MKPATVALAILFACTVACTHITTAAPPNAGWKTFVDRYVETYYAANPQHAVYAGLHQFDGKLPDVSAAALASRVRELREQRAAAEVFSSLSSADEFERQYLIARIDQELFWIDSARWPYRNPLYYSGILSPSIYVSRQYAPAEQRMRAVIAWAVGVPRILDAARANLRTPLPRPMVETAIGNYGGLAGYVRNDLPAIFAGVGDSALQSEFRTALNTAADSLDAFNGWLKSELPRANSDFALGAQLYREMLRATERVDIPLERLEEIGRQDLERNLALLREACVAYAPGKSVEECVAIAEAKKPPEGPVRAAQKQLKELKQFVRDSDIATIPSEEEAMVAEAPPYNRFNIAYIEIAGPFEHNVPSIYFIAPPDPAWSDEEQKAYIPSQSFLLMLSVHEVWPGHFLNRLHQRKLESKIARLFSSYSFSEGWAHYTEEMAYDAGLGNGDPEIRIGQLLNALLRNVRYVSALGLHTGGMTVEESERLFREKAFRDPGNARQQARRGTYDPAYLNYTLGKLMIMKLRDDWTRTRGGRAAWKQFHDTLLSYGDPPLPLVRRWMLGDDSPAL